MTDPRPAPHARRIDDVLDELDVEPSAGLSAAEARARLHRFGANEIERRRRRSAWKIAVDQFIDPVILLLLGAAIASAALGNMLEGIAIAIALLINAGIGFATEHRAARSMEALRRIGQPHARVRRDSRTQEVAAGDLVVGDIVLLEPGDFVPADARIIDATRFQCDEAALTGESLPMTKGTEPLEGEAVLADRTNMAWRGTTATRGQAEAVVTHTGMDTELGRIADMVSGAEPGDSPLQKRLDRLARQLLWVALGVGALLALVGVASGVAVRPMIETAVIMAIAAIPEGLPVVATIALSRGMWRMARRDAIVNRLSSVETLGTTQVILSDKTGTLTANEMRARQVLLAGRELDVGQGDAEPDDDPRLVDLARVITLCNDAELDDEGDAHGDPTEVALRRLGRQLGAPVDARERSAEIDREAFSPATKMMATVHRVDDGDGDRVLVAVKGAPEAVLQCCTRVAAADAEATELSEEDRAQWQRRNEALAARGQRVMAVAMRSSSDPDPAPYESLTLLGLVGMYDPPREDVAEALAQCREAGIRVVMATGDQTATGIAIAQELGIADEDAKAITGAELDQWLAAEDADLSRVSVFARVTPEQKLALVEAFRDDGVVVGMTGDGVNDAPGLRTADIGIAMGRRGTDAAREASDVVVEDDSFATIVAAIAQGRTIFANIRRFIIYLLSGNLAEIFAVATAAVAAAPLPLLPLQILYINLLFDVFPALGLALSPGDPEAAMSRAPRDPGEPILTTRNWLQVAGYGLLIAASVLAAAGVSLWHLDRGVDRAVTTAFLGFCVARLLHVFNMRDPDDSLVRSDVVRSPSVWIAIGVCGALIALAVLVPPVATALHVAPIDAIDWLLIAAAGVVPIVVGQLVHVVRRALSRPDPTPQP